MPFVRFEDVVADLKTPPCNLATAKFSSMRAEVVLALRVLGFGKNGLDFAFVEATGSNVCVIYSDLFLEVEEMIERRGQTVCAAGY